MTAARTLPFTMQLQLQPLWCWAATAASVSAYYAASTGEAPIDQRAIASKCLGMDCSLPHPPPGWVGNQLYALNIALLQTGHFNGPAIQGPLDFAMIQREIDAGRPVCCFIAWSPGAPLEGHFNAMVGYVDDGSETVIVQDPSPSFGGGMLPLASFRSNYHGGTWAMTFRTK